MKRATALLALLFALSFSSLACTTGPQTGNNNLALTNGFDQAPEGFSRTDVLGVAATPDGTAVVVLGSPEREQVLPIFIDPVQAVTIDLRQRGQRFNRPLTHDLLENIIAEMGGEIAKVHVHALHESTYYATIFIANGEKVFEIDARPSDAIALALGKNIPIYVNNEVLDAGGFTEDELLEEPPSDLGPGDPDAPTTI